MNKVIFIFILTAFLSSCSDLEELNQDTNRARSTHPQFLLSQIEWDSFRDYGGTPPLYASKMLVQTDGENANQYYKWDRGSFTAYTRMKDVTKMMEEASKLENESYIALAKFFRAYHFFNLTLTFGDIPYSESLEGESDKIYTPKYDSQKEVLQGILKELEEANTILKTRNNNIEGDIIYNGDPLKWQKLINSYRLKILMMLSKKAGDSDLNIQSIFSSIVQNENLIESNAENAQLIFLDQEGNRYPEFNSSSYGSGMYVDSTFIRLLQDKEDPRLFVYCTQTKEAKEAGKAINDFTAYEGGDPAAPYATVNEKATKGKISKVNERYHKNPTNEPMVLMGYAELQFILGEAVVRNWITGDAKQYYDNGVKSAFKFYETYAKEYTQYLDEAAAVSYLSKPSNDFSTATSDAEKIELLISQRYLQSFFQSGWSAFYNHLRTGYPEFYRPTGVNIPYRWMYPQTEYNNNATNVSSAINNQFGTGNDKIDQPTWWIK